MSRPRRSLEQLLVERGDAESLDAARALVAAGRVLVGGATAATASRQVARDEPVRVVSAPRFVGRGGQKLDGALDELGVDVSGRLALDVGSSTGGFTDCLLARGATRVLAVDVGRHQLHERLRADQRVVSVEETNVRDLTVEQVRAALGALPSIVSVDLSFTTVTRHAAHLVELAEADADLLVLVKPQFEVDHVEASRGRGVVRDPAAWRSALGRAASAFDSVGAGIMGAVAAPLAGASGNVEFFLLARGGSPTPPGLESRLDALAAGSERP